MTISIAEALRQGTQVLNTTGVPEPRKEAASLLAWVMAKDRTFLISHSDALVTDDVFSSFNNTIRRRANGEPLQYIVGSQDFFGRAFKVTPDVLIPRPETELLVEAALQLLDNVRPGCVICDVGTGSGCIAISLLCERRNLQALALDISPQAIKVALQNAISHGVEKRVSFIVSDCFEAISVHQKFDLIVSNPPYVASGALQGLQREVKDHEPVVALTPGGDGLTIIRRLLDEAPGFLKDDGYLLFEIGFDQGETVTKLINPTTWRLLEILPDLQGIPRIVSLQKCSK